MLFSLAFLLNLFGDFGFLSFLLAFNRVVLVALVVDAVHGLAPSHIPELVTKAGKSCKLKTGLSCDGWISELVWRLRLFGLSSGVQSRRTGSSGS
jgi:hypothetical protein